MDIEPPTDHTDQESSWSFSKMSQQDRDEVRSIISSEE
jgi:hypothetical protein